MSSSPLYEIVVKGFPEGDQDTSMDGELADCSLGPFCHRVLLTLEEKHIPYSMRYVKKGKFPDWLVQVNPEKKVPVMKDFEESRWIPDSATIVDYLEKKHPTPPLGRSSDADAYVTKFVDMFSNLFSRFVGALKATSEDKATSKEALRSELSAVSKKLEDHKFYKGEVFSAADAALAPKLHHIVIMMATAEDWDVCEDYPAVKAYMTRVKSRPSWKACLYSDIIVEAEWTKALNS